MDMKFAANKILHLIYINNHLLCQPYQNFKRRMSKLKKQRVLIKFYSRKNYKKKLS